MKFLSTICLIFSFILYSGNVGAQVSTDNENSEESQNIELMSMTDLDEMSLEDLLNLKITVASGDAGVSTREAPGIVSLITAREIKNSGARDLMDVLKLVPGFSFGGDGYGVVGLGIRGNWAHEGKILLLIDGQECNELAYQTLQFGNHFPVENIKRIEIIRGPGSAIYGGYAELAVINVITYGAADFQGVSLSGTLSQMKDSYGRRNLHLAYAQKFNDIAFTSSIFFGQGMRSDRDFSDFYGDTYSLADNAELNPLFVNLGLQVKDFSMRFILDHYQTTQRDVYFVNAPEAVECNFYSYYLEMKYAVHVSDTLTITPILNYKRQKPYFADSSLAKQLDADFPDEYGGVYTDELLERTTGKVKIAYLPRDSVKIQAGLEYYQDRGKDSVRTPYNGKSTVDYSNSALYAQAIMNTSYANFTLGVRYDEHSEIGSSVVPRLGVTKIFGDFHAKLLYAQAFRSPGIHNIADFSDPENESEQITEEHTTVMEVEAGYKLTKNMFIVANFFDIVIDDPIVYYYDDGDKYANFETTGTRGLEIEFRLKGERGYATVGYSYYRVNENKVDQYAIRDTGDMVVEDAMLLGMPSNKITLNATLQLAKHISLNPSCVHYGEKYGYTAVTEDDVLIAEKLSAETILNVNILCEDLYFQNLDLSVGCYNILDEKELYVQPYYDGYHAPLPGPSREYFLKLSYLF